MLETVKQKLTFVIVICLIMAGGILVILNIAAR